MTMLSSLIPAPLLPTTLMTVHSSNSISSPGEISPFPLHLNREAEEEGSLVPG